MTSVLFQVLLSQVHRLRALELLGQFLDLGPWAVSLVCHFSVLFFYSNTFSFTTEVSFPATINIFFLKESAGCGATRNRINLAWLRVFFQVFALLK